MRAQSRGRSAGIVVLGVLMGTVVGAGPAFADISPTPDPAMVGALTLCNAQGQQVTSGQLTAKPAVSKAIAVTRAPKGYGKDGTATLYAFQPRPGVAPSQWSGEQLTSSSHYSEAAHPMAVGTPADESFAKYLVDYPLAASGVFQLRAYLGAPGLPPFSTSYDGSFIEVSGTSWKQLDPGPNNCSTAGTAVSLETMTLPHKTFTKAQKADAQSASSATSSQLTSGSSGRLAGRSGRSTSIANAVPSAESTSTSNAGRNLAIVLTLAALAGVGGIVLSMRRRS